ncbi:GtrA family protein [Streptomyces lycii]|uniref:GtrA family protein n=1 Tax=Streptomyces lycii TaxID=2654337 RepID=A0ABQ7FGZ8_9ACTN|nr:GtrA family protein [Streptomyces lycii]KAF4406508.1 GtrA family protein [Streptomyces lycii]
MTERPSLRTRLRGLAHEVGKFGAVGAVGTLVNFLVFNLCVHGFGLAVVRSGVIATVVAIGTNYLGNRHWTYRDSDKSRQSRELTLFAVFSGVGLVIENGTLAISHYALGYTSTLADNLAKNVIGVGIASVFRFWSYRTWVFRALPEPVPEPEAVPVPAQGTGAGGGNGAGPGSGSVAGTAAGSAAGTAARSGSASGSPRRARPVLRR